VTGGRVRYAAGAWRAAGRRAPAVLPRVGLTLTLALLALPAAAHAQALPHREGPYDVPLFNTPRTARATGLARLVYASSPFGIAVTIDGVDRYDVRLSLKGMPAPSALGPYKAYVAWQVSTDLSHWKPLGEVRNGTNVVGTTDLNKFLLVITAEASANADTHQGPIVLHGTSPSGWLENFLTHDAFFRGVNE
jgi:hypothetical protein